MFVLVLFVFVYLLYLTRFLSMVYMYCYCTVTFGIHRFMICSGLALLFCYVLIFHVLEFCIRYGFLLRLMIYSYQTDYREPIL